MNWKSLRLTWLLAAYFIFNAAENAHAQPVLTTVQDMVYLADGSRFNGLAYLEWKSFETPNGSVIGQYSKVVRIIDGLVRVQLAPTTLTTNAYYSVKYSSGGRVLFSEIWAVPQSTSVLKLKDVRATLLPGGYVTSPSTAGGSGQPPVIGEDTTGLFVDAETPVGPLNGTNLVFTLSKTPTPPESLGIYRNGVRLSPTVDYSVSGSTITFVSGAVPQAEDYLRAYYRTGSIAPHGLLSAIHTDTYPEDPRRGDIITGQQDAARWTRLPIGGAGRCLTSNTIDALWGACLYTGFPSGAVAFTAANGSLSQDASTFFWDAANKRLSLGNSSPSANLTIQATPSQGASNLTRWLNSGGVELGRMEFDGGLVVSRLTTSTTSSRAAWRDAGSGGDPTSRLNGDFWFNNAQQARKSFEAGQIHPLPQVLCSVGGAETISTTPAQLGSCTVPASFFDAGDRIEILFNVEHTGGLSGFTLDFRIGSNVAWSRTFSSATETLAFVRSSGAFYPGATPGSNPPRAAFGTESFGAVTPIAGSPSILSQNLSSAFTISFRGNLVADTLDKVILRNFTIVRYPAQFNP